MILALTVVGCMTVLAVAFILSPGFRDTDRLVDRLGRERVVVTLDDGTAFDGVLYDSDPSTVLLKDASALGAGGERTPADGELLLPRNRISYLQHP